MINNNNNNASNFSYTLSDSLALQHNKYKQVFQALFPIFVLGKSCNVAPPYIMLRQIKYQTSSALTLQLSTERSTSAFLDTTCF